MLRECLVQCAWDLAFGRGSPKRWDERERQWAECVLLVQVARELVPYLRAEGSCGCFKRGTK